jgi:hypothetical protein
MAMLAMWMKLTTAQKTAAVRIVSIIARRLVPRHDRAVKTQTCETFDWRPQPMPI